MRRHRERDLRDEAEFHRAMATRAGRPAGEFGPADLWLEMSRDLRATRGLEDLWRDLRFALRRLRGAPGFMLVALVTLALGIGANTALFTVVDAVMLRQLPVPHPDALVTTASTGFGSAGTGTDDHDVMALTYQQYLDLRDAEPAFSGLMATSNFTANLPIDWGAGPEAGGVEGLLVSDNFFSVLGLAPARGHFFDSPLAPEAVLSFAYWRRQFGGADSVLGRTLRLHDTAFTVVGIAPAGFTGISTGDEPAVYLPISLQPQILTGHDWLHDPPGIRRTEWVRAFGRLRPGRTLAQAQAQTGVIFARSVEEQAAQAPQGSVRTDLLTQRLPLVPAGRGASSIAGSFGQPLLMVFGLVALILILVVVNLGGMLTAQSATRRREFNLRLSLGCSQARLMRQLFTESLALVMAGGVAGWALALWGERLLIAMVARQDASLALTLSPDWRVFAFAAAVCIIAGLGVGLAPALGLRRTRLAERLGPSGVTSAGGRLLVIAQVALSLTLVAAGALFVRSLSRVQSLALGFDPHGLTTFDLNAPAAGAKGAQALGIYHNVLDALQRLPGVRGVAVSENGLFSGNDSNSGVSVQGYSGSAPVVRWDKIAPGYFAALGVHMLAGREFTEADTGASVKRIVIDEIFARTYFAGRNPLGQHVTVHFSDSDLVGEVVGVSAKVLQQEVRKDVARPRMYLDMFNGRDPGDTSAVYYIVRAAPDAPVTRTTVDAAVASAAGRSLRSRNWATVETLLTATQAPELLLASLAEFFGFLALLIAAIGLYALLAYAVARRSSEIGVRMVLGARASQVLAMILREALMLIAAGTAIGIAATLLAGRSLASLLYRVRPDDPVSLAAAAGLLWACGLAAALVPAVRAARTDPARTLRAE